MPIFTVTGAVTSRTGAPDLCELQPADDKSIEILNVKVWQTTELGDAQEEGVTIALVRGHTSSGSGGSAATPADNSLSGATSATTVESHNTTPASGGTTSTHALGGWNLRAPFDRPFTPEEWIGCSQAHTCVVLRILESLADAVSIGWSITFEEG